MKSTNGELLLMAVGDVYVNRPDPASVFAHVAPVLRQADVLVGNLEGVVTDRGTPIVGKFEVGSRHLRCAPSNLAAFASAGFTAVGLANNHNMDYGPEGLLHTVELLDQMNIAHAGGGRNLDDAHTPALVERNGVKVALLSYTSLYTAGFPAQQDKPGLSTIKVHTSYQAPENNDYQPGFPPVMVTIPSRVDQDRMEQDVREAKKVADIVVVAFHWGVSWGFNRVVGYQKELGRAAIDAGADLIIGAHPHALQGMEIYKGKLICYCLGNFVMDGLKLSHFSPDSMILKCQVKDKRITRVSFVPVLISGSWQPVIREGEQIVAAKEKMEAVSEEFGTMFALEGGEIVVTGRKPDFPEGRRGLEIEPLRGVPVLYDPLLPLPYIGAKLKELIDLKVGP